MSATLSFTASSPEDFVRLNAMTAALAGISFSCTGNTSTGNTNTGTSGSTGNTVSTGNTSSSAVPTIDYFPSTPGTAPFPSPENSSSVWISGKVEGAPYLRDSNGTIYMIVPTGAAVTATNNGASLAINGAVYLSYSVPYLPSSLILRSGGVYIEQFPGGQFQQFVAAMGSIYNAGLPAIVVAGAAATVTTTATKPTPSAVAPGSSGKIILCGPSQTIKTLAAAVAAAAAGDTIQLDKGVVFAESVHVPVSLLIDGQGTSALPFDGAILDGTTLNDVYAFGKGGLVPTADCIISGLEVRGFGMTEKQSGGTAGIRPDTGCGYLAVKNCYIHGNQTGIFSGVSNLYMTVDGGTLVGNGLGDGYSHNIYHAGPGGSFTARSMTSIGPLGGHAVKSRAAFLTITGGSLAASDATAIDIPDGTSAPFAVISCTITKATTDANHGILGYCTESTNNGMAGGVVIGCTLVTDCQSPQVLVEDGTVTFSNNTIGPNTLTAAGGGKVLGLT